MSTYEIRDVFEKFKNKNVKIFNIRKIDEDIIFNLQYKNKIFINIPLSKFKNGGDYY